jgi:alpha-L-rhamnosidase
LFWDSGYVEDTDSINIKYEGSNLNSMTLYHWNLFVTDSKGNVHESADNRFSTGFFEEDKEYKWISHPGETENPIFYGDLYVKDNVDYCLAAISGLGYYELKINDVKTGEYLNVPGWTDYARRELSNLLYPYTDRSSKRVLYNVYDITGLLSRGLNRFEAMLGNGFFNQIERSIEGDMSYGKPRLFLEFTMVYKDGNRDSFSVDENTFCTEGPLEFNNIYFGEIRNDNIGLSFDGDYVSEIIKWNHGKMKSQYSAFDYAAGEFIPVSIGDNIYDAGTNLTGRVIITAKAPRGAGFSLEYFETMKDGKPDFSSSGGEWQIQENRYTFGENKTVEYRETFGWRGFRYFRLQMDEDVEILDIRVEEVYGTPKGPGSFNCSEKNIEWIYNSYKKTQLSNMHGGVPSDCPHRERLGYTGDGQVTCESALLTLDSVNFYRKWLYDIMASQDSETGFVPHTVPFYGGGGGPAWGSSCAVVPWILYNHTFDEGILKEAYPVVCKWIGYLEKKNPGLIIRTEGEGSWCLGDWCMPVAGYEVEEVDLDAIFDAMDPAIVNTCYFYKCITICIDIGKIIGRSTIYYERLAKRVREKFNEEFLDKENMNYGTGNYCSNVYPLAFDIVPKELESAVAASLEEYIRSNDYSMMVGIFGASMIFGVLSRFGYGRTVKSMLDRREYPSFGYMMDKGATTIWETWDGNASGNHPMFGSVVTYFIKNLAGLRFYSKDGLFLLEPEFLEGVNYVSCKIPTVFGTAGIEWERLEKQKKIKVRIKLPGNTRGALRALGETIIVENGITDISLDCEKTGVK